MRRPSLPVQRTAVKTEDASPGALFSLLVSPAVKSRIPSAWLALEVGSVLRFRSLLVYLQNEHLGTFELLFCNHHVASLGTLCTYTPHTPPHAVRLSLTGGSAFLTVQTWKSRSS